MRDDEVYIGGNSKGEKSANVMLLNFELYWKAFDQEQQLEPNDYLVPQEMVDLVCHDMDNRRLRVRVLSILNESYKRGFFINEVLYQHGCV